jgi:hypothetical protein
MISNTAAKCLSESPHESFMRWFETKMTELEKTNFLVMPKQKTSQAVGFAKTERPRTPATMAKLAKAEEILAANPNISRKRLSKLTGVCDKVLRAKFGKAAYFR